MKLKAGHETHKSTRALAAVVLAACSVLPGATLWGQRSGVNPPKVMTPAEFKAALTSLPADVRLAIRSSSSSMVAASNCQTSATSARWATC